MRETPSVPEIEEAVRKGILRGTHAHFTPSAALLRAVSLEVMSILQSDNAAREPETIPASDTLGSAG